MDLRATWTVLVSLTFSLGGMAWAQTPPASGPTQEDMQFVRTTLATVKPGDSASADQAARAILARDAAIVPALHDAFATAKPEQRYVLTEAIARLDWQLTPRTTILDFVRKAGVADADLTRVEGPYPVIDPEVWALLPHHLFYALRFPAGQKTPEPLAQWNLFAIDREGRVTHFAQPNDLIKFYSPLVTAKDEAGALRAARAWLALSQEFSRTTSLEFAAPTREAVQAGKGYLLAEAKLEAVPPGRGEIAVCLAFEADGRLSGIKEQRQSRTSTPSTGKVITNPIEVITVSPAGTTSKPK